jgi:hypothetical protein
MRCLDRGRHGCFDNRGYSGRRGMFGSHRNRPSGRCSGRRRSRLDHRRGTFPPRRFGYRRRSNVCGWRKAGCGRRNPGRQQGQRIDVALRIARHAGPEVHVRVGQVDRAARADGSHDSRFSYELSARHGDRPEVDERGRISGRRLDRHRLAAGRHGPGKGHHTLCGCEHGAAGVCTKIDTPVLSARVGVRVVEQKRPHHRPVDRPRPRACGGDGKRARTNDQNCKSPHGTSLLPRVRTTRP